MKTEQTAKVTKAEILQALMEAIDKHTPEKHDLFHLLNAIRQAAGFLDDQRFANDKNVISLVKYLREDLTKSKNSFIGVFESLTESSIEAQILSGQLTEGLNLLAVLDPEFEKLAIQVEESM